MKPWISNKESSNHNSIDHPPHYTFGSIEVINVIEDWKLGYNLGNVIKYIARADHKGNRLEDLLKAQWYLKREIENIKKNESANNESKTNVG